MLQNLLDLQTTRYGFLCFSFYRLCSGRTDDVTAGFYLDARIQGKSYGHNIKDEVDKLEKGFSLFFLRFVQISEIRVRLIRVYIKLYIQTRFHGLWSKATRSLRGL